MKNPPTQDSFCDKQYVNKHKLKTYHNISSYIHTTFTTQDLFFSCRNIIEAPCRRDLELEAACNVKKNGSVKKTTRATSSAPKKHMISSSNLGACCTHLFDKKYCPSFWAANAIYTWCSLYLLFFGWKSKNLVFSVTLKKTRFFQKNLVFSVTP